MKTLAVTNEFPTELKLGTHFNNRSDRVKKNDCKDTTIDKMFNVERDGRIQLHIVLSNAQVLIVDPELKRIITLINAREGQLKRLYNPLGMEVPEYLVTKARLNNNSVINS